MANKLYQQCFSLLTLHKKDEVIAPLLAQDFNASLTVKQAFDTHTLSRLRGEIERELTPKKTVHFKKY